jgi:hypothetical protein
MTEPKAKLGLSISDAWAAWSNRAASACKGSISWLHPQRHPPILLPAFFPAVDVIDISQSIRVAASQQGPAVVYPCRLLSLAAQ